MKPVFVLFIIIFTYSAVPSLSGDTLYKWTDKDGIVHYTNIKSSISDKNAEKILFPGEQKEFNENNVDTEPSERTEDYKTKETEQNLSREYWRGLAKSIEDREEVTRHEIILSKERIRQLKKEIDYYLLNGYAADYMIFELKNLERKIIPLEKELEILKDEKLLLKKKARRHGIPPGYLRP